MTFKKSFFLQYKQTILIFVVSLLCTILLSGCFLTTINYILNGKILEEDGNQVIENSDVPTPVEIKEKQMNILVCGIDSGQGRKTSLTDVIMMVNIDFGNSKINILQIPRDTHVGFEEIWTGKINGVYNAGTNGKGINGLKNVINSKFKINIDYYVTMNLDGFKSIVDAIGGVPINLKEDFYFPEEGYEDILLPAGEHVLKGRDAEAFIRERDNRGSDISREKLGQRVFVAAFINKLMGMNKADLITKIVPEVFKFVKTDFSLSEVGKYADGILKMDISNITFDMVPGEAYYHKLKNQWLYLANINPLLDIINTKFRQYMEPINKQDFKLSNLDIDSDKYVSDGADVGSLIN